MLSSAQQQRHAFWLADACFAVMLLILGVLSVIWHASNAPKSQYIDLWSMDCSIAFLIVRIFCTGGAVFFGPKHTEQIALVCAGLFSLVILSNGWHHYNNYCRRWLDAGCPFAGRTRLLFEVRAGPVTMGGDQGAPMTTFQVCAFGGMPLIYMVVPGLIQVLVIGSMGSTNYCRLNLTLKPTICLCLPNFRLCARVRR